MRKTSIAMEAGQEGSLREGLEIAIRERVREIIEMVLEEEVESALGASRSQRVAERVGYRHGHKSRRLTLRTGTVQLKVPRARMAEADGSEREWQSQLVRRYRRSSPEVEQKAIASGRNAIWPKSRSSISTSMRSIPRCAVAGKWYRCRYWWCWGFGKMARKC